MKPRQHNWIERCWITPQDCFRCGLTREWRRGQERDEDGEWIWRWYYSRAGYQLNQVDDGQCLTVDEIEASEPKKPKKPKKRRGGRKTGRKKRTGRRSRR